MNQLIQAVPITAPYEFHRSKKLAKAHISSTNALLSAPEVIASRRKRLNDNITEILADELAIALSAEDFRVVHP